MKSYSIFACLLLLVISENVKAQNFSKANFKLINAAAGCATTELTINNLLIDIDEKGQVTCVNYFYNGNCCTWTAARNRRRNNDKIETIGDLTINYWDKGWGKEKEGKLKSIGNITFDFWSQGWGEESEGKLKTIGDINFSYWSKGWGEEKEGKLKTIGNIDINYWGEGWGKEKVGKLKTIGDITIDYYGFGWGSEKEGKIQSVEGNSEKVFATVIDLEKIDI
jgi:hypothetical protein